MLKLSKYCLFSFIVAIIEITWSAFDLVEEAVVFFFSSDAVGKFFIKVDKKKLISLADSEAEEQTNIFYWLLLLIVILVNCVWVLAAFKLMYGIIKLIFQDDRLNAIKCCRFWFQFSWLLLIIFGVKIFRNSSGLAAFLYASAVVIYRGASMYFVHAFAKELEFAELMEPNPIITTTTSQIHYDLRPAGLQQTQGAVSAEVKTAPSTYEHPMSVFDVHRV